MRRFHHYALILVTTLLAQCGKPSPSHLDGESTVDPIDWPETMVVVGDSRGAGVFAQTKLGEHLNREATRQFLTVGFFLNWLELQEWLTGRSPGQGVPEQFEGVWSMRKILNNHDLTAYSGNHPDSHAAQIRAANENALEVINASIPAGIAPLLPLTIDKILEERNPNQPILDYWIFDYGAPDFIIGTQEHKFRASYQKAVKKVLAYNPDARILLVELPSIVSLMEYRDRNAFSVGWPWTRFHATCIQAWRLLNVGKKVVRDYDEDPTALEARLESYNQVLRDIAHQAGSQIALTRYPDPVPEALAADCWHPNAHGNRLVARKTWQAAKALFRHPSP